MDRVVIFSNSTDFREHMLVSATLAAIRQREDMQLAAVCLPRTPDYRRMLYRYRREQLVGAFKAVTRSGTGPQTAVIRPLDFARLAELNQFRLLVPPRGDINRPSFIEQLGRELKPTVALSYFCLKRFSRELLSVFDYAVNYHNGLLPAYKGLQATAWSVYHGEAQTGFTFHRMTEDLDRGNILLQQALPVGPADRTVDLDLAKVRLAMERIPELLQMVAERNAGKTQVGEGSYFSRKDFQAMIRIADPKAVSSVELARRLRAFALLEVLIGGRWYRVTGIRPAPKVAEDNVGRLCFQTADGVRMRVTHLDFLPRALFSARAFLRRSPERGR